MGFWTFRKINATRDDACCEIILWTPCRQREMRITEARATGNGQNVISWFILVPLFCISLTDCSRCCALFPSSPHTCMSCPALRHHVMKCFSFSSPFTLLLFFCTKNPGHIFYGTVIAVPVMHACIAYERSEYRFRKWLNQWESGSSLRGSHLQIRDLVLEKEKY